MGADFARALREQELWSDECGGLDAFVQEVEKSKEFAFALEAVLTIGDVLEQEE